MKNLMRRERGDREGEEGGGGESDRHLDTATFSRTYSKHTCQKRFNADSEIAHRRAERVFTIRVNLLGAHKLSYTSCTVLSYFTEGKLVTTAHGLCHTTT